MKTSFLTELSQTELIQINGGTDDPSYDAGYAAGQVVGRMIRGFLTLTGICKVLSIL